MGSSAPEKCFITGVPTRNHLSDKHLIEYFINFNSKEHFLRFAPNIDWQNIKILNNLFILRALLYNNEWPLDPDTIITQQLLENIIDCIYEEYPKDFDDKVEHILVSLYDKSGKDYKRFLEKGLELNELSTYSKDELQFWEIIRKLSGLGFIKRIPEGGHTLTTEIELTPAGIQEAEKIKDKKQAGKRIIFDYGKQPVVLFCYLNTVTDKSYVDKLKELFLKNSISVKEEVCRTPDGDLAFSEGIKKSIFSDDYKYLLFFRSAGSDTSNAMGEAATYAIEKAQELGSTNYPFLYNIKTDDTPLGKRPRLQLYSYFDIRIIPARSRLVKRIAADWSMKLKNYEAEKENRNPVEKIDSSKTFLKWLAHSYQNRPRNPVDVSQTKLSALISSEIQLKKYISEIEYQGFINQERHKGFGDDESLYVLTLLDKFFNEIDNLISDKDEERSIEKLKDHADEIVEGLAAADATGWFEDKIDEIRKNKYATIWWDKLPSGSNSNFDTLKKLRDRINKQGYFEFYFTKNKSTHYKAVIKDFSIASDYNFNGWMNKYPGISLHKNFNEYQEEREGSNHKKASIVFVTDSLQKTEPRIPDTNFNFNGFRSPVQNNLQPYVKLKTPVEQKPLEPTSIYIEGASDFSISDKFDGVLGVKELAGELLSMLKRLDDPQGNMVGIFGKWGRGKTFLWKEIRNILTKKVKVETKPGKKNSRKTGLERLKLLFKRNKRIEKDTAQPNLSFIPVEYHAWKYQDTPAAWAYLYETLADEFFKGNLLKKIFKRIILNIKRRGKGSLYQFLFILVITITSSIFVSIEFEISIIKFVLSSIGLVAGIKLLYLYYSYKPKAIALFNLYSEKVSFHKYLGIQAEIQKEICFLCKTWIKTESLKNKKILIFVDDIDRCSEEKIISIIDSFRVMLEEGSIADRVIVLMAIDETVLKMAIKNKYCDLVSNNFIAETNEIRIAAELNRMAKEYIDKLFIGGVKLGILTSAEKRDIFNNVTKGKVNFEVKEQEKKEHDSSIIENNRAETEEAQNIPSEYITEVEMVQQANPKYEIEKVEYDFLMSSIIEYKQATPRSIRIYYYRYLLAKKIMKHRFVKGTSLYNSWHSGAVDKKILPSLIIQYSLSNTGSEDLAEEKVSVTQEESSSIQKDVLGKTFTIRFDLYKELLSIVEMVVPY